MLARPVPTWLSAPPPPPCMAQRTGSSLGGGSFARCSLGAASTGGRSATARSISRRSLGGLSGRSLGGSVFLDGGECDEASEELPPADELLRSIEAEIRAKHELVHEYVLGNGVDTGAAATAAAAAAMVPDSISGCSHSMAAAAPAPQRKPSCMGCFLG